MKHKKSFLKKFHRKYLFLQNSLSDFLYWRTSNQFKQKEPVFITNNKILLQSKSYLLEHDKICLQEYWKSSENQKIRNAIQNINTNWNFSNNFSKQEKTNIQSTSLNEYSFSYLPPVKTKKETKNYSQFPEKAKWNEKKYKSTCFRFQKKLKNFSQLQRGNSKFETLIPESDCFQKFNPFPFFANGKIGQFFPKKKNFQQYWIFPLLGFVVFFSSSSSFEKKTLPEKTNQNKIYLEKNTFVFQTKASEKSFKNTLFSDFENKQNKNVYSANFLPEKSFFADAKKPTSFAKNNPYKQIVYFSYSDQFSKESYHQLQELETNEFQKFCNFYLTFFQNSMTNFLFDKKENKIFQNSLFDTSNLKIVKQNTFKKTLETKRNVLNWKWFSLNSEFLTSEQINKFNNFSNLEIPQKAQFLFLKNEKQFFSSINSNFKKNKVSKFLKNQKLFSKLTPVLEFSKAGFVLNEFQRNLTVNSPNSNFAVLVENNNNFIDTNNKNVETVFQNIEFPFLKDSSIQKQEFLSELSFQNFTGKHFLNNLDKEDFKFLNSLFSEQKTCLEIQKSLDSNFVQKNFINLELNENNLENFKEVDSKNLFFLQKWLQTQNFWQIQQKFSNLKNFQLFNQSTPLPFSTASLNKKTKKYSNFKHLQSIQQNFNVENLINLDSLYLQKLFKSFQSKNQIETKKNKIDIPFSNFSQLVYSQNSQNLKNIQNHVQKSDLSSMQHRLEMKRKKKLNFSKFKKQTFEFFTFQYYNKNYKKIYKQFSLKKNAFFISSLPSELTFKKKNQELFKNLKKTCFLNNFINKQFLENKILKTSGHSNKITNLEIPIYLDFSNTKSFENKFFVQEKQNNRIFQNFQQIFLNENVESRPNSLSSNYFHLNSNKFVPNISVQAVNSLENNKISENIFWTQTKKNINSIKSIFYCSKNDFFETLCENTFKNLKTKFCLNISNFKFFKKSFFVERMKKQKPFVFQSIPNLTLTQNSKLQAFFLKSSHSFVLKQKNNSIDLNELKIDLKKDFKKYKKNVYNFQSRKFEKIFKTFLSSVNKEKIENSFVKDNIHTQNQSFKRHRTSKMLNKFKTQNDSLLLQTLSNSLKKESKNTNSIFFISSPFCQKQKTIISKTNLQFAQNNDSQSNAFLKQIKNNSKVLKRDFSLTIQKDSIRPTLLLKRDGFVSVPKFDKISDFKMEKFFLENKKLFQNNDSYLSQISQKDENSLTVLRLEKEKALQKKRRMKKQKLETRRRKKRKRFFPRPVWLRFHLYKKFLKSRHPEKFIYQNQILFPFSETQNQIANKVGLFARSKQNFLQNAKAINQAKNLKSICFIYPKFFKNQNFKEFCFSNTKKLYFSIDSSFEKRWKNVFSSLKNETRKYKVQKNFYNSLQNVKTNQKFESKIFLEKNPNKSNLLKNQHELEEMKIYHRNQQKWGFYWKNGFQEKIFYNKFPVHKNFHKKTNFFYGSENNPISQNQEDYKISGEILSEFIRLSWKSYWFQMNFQPYTHRITENFRKMQQIESQKNFSDFNLFHIFGNIQYPSLFSGSTPIFQSTAQDHSQNDLILKKSLLKKFLWYSNIRNSLESKPIVRDRLITGSQSFLNFQNMQNFPEYNRIVYSRVSEILKNFKSSETNDDHLNQASQKILKIPKRKSESFSPNTSIFTKSALFAENFNLPSQPFIPAFSMFSSLFNDASIKPTGEIATLRALWALNQTNLYHFQEKNSIRNLWTLKKTTDRLKSLKATKKAVHYFKQYSGLEKFNAPKILKSFVFAQADQHLQKNQSQKLVFKDVFLPTFFKEKQSILTDSQKLETNKLLVLSTLNSGFKDFVQQLDTMSLQKFMAVQQKCALFGIKTFQQNSKISLRYLKFHLLSKNQKQNFSEILKQKNKQSSNLSFSNTHQLEQFISPFDQFKKPNPQNSAKSSLNFWWSQKNSNNFEFLLSSQNKVGHHFDCFGNNEVSFFAGSEKTLNNFYKPEQLHQLSSHMQQRLKNMNQTTQSDMTAFSIFAVEQKNAKWFGLQTQFLWFGALVFHLALVFSLFKLPEIRSVFKFTLVLFYKFFNGFFVVVFSIYNLFKKYTTRGTHVVNKIIKLSNSSLNSEKSFLPFQSNFSTNSELQKFAFFRTKCIQERNFKNLFVSSLLYSKTFQIFFSNKKTPQSLLFLNFNDLLILKMSKNQFFDFFVRLSEFSFVSSSKKISSKNFEQIQKQNSFFNSQKNHVHNFSVLKISSTAASQKIASLFYLKKNKLVVSSVFSADTLQQKQLNKKSLQKQSLNFFKNARFVQTSNNKVTNQSSLSLKTMNRLSNTEKFICQFALSLLVFGKATTQMSYGLVRLSSSISAKIFDLFEMLMFSIYKFLEKPAELMIEWIALIFLIEWSSDIATFLPDSFDISLAKTSQKLLRPVRSGSLILTFLGSQNGVMPLNSAFFPSTLFNSFAFFGYSNMLSFVFQKRILYFFENFSFVLTQPDMDILIRQKKGMIFWDIWAEILLKAAEKYNVNIPSFVTLKEEQELFIERLLQDQQFLKNLQVEKSTPRFVLFETKKQNFNGEIIQQNSLASFVENFLVKERPLQFALFSNQNNKSIHQLNLFSQIFASSFDVHLNSSNSIQNNQFAKFLSFVFLQKTNFANILQIQPSSLYVQEYKDVFQNVDRWACHQYGTYQGPETDLFVDIHPPKSLKDIQFFKYYEPAQYTLGAFICQIYAGIFSKQVAKNILVIGSPGTAKTLFIQALAGETEMKIITDNAYRYSMVQRGVAVGMKYLRDVFDALVLQTPCFFLMEDIHVIGSKRPLLISDDENVKGIQSSFGLDQQEVHETNQMIYQFNRHSISDYKRPYKGDFSMGIPTNFFIQNFYSKFEKNSTSVFKNSQFSAGGINFMDRNSPISPLPIDSIEKSLLNQGLSQKQKTDTAFQNSFRSETFKKGVFNFQSRLQISTEQIFAPPATSPFTILMMKEQKKLKPKKIVQETSWGGLSTDQMISYQKQNSSVRAKVAVLADITINLSRGKLDMITDLLVIIDSVRSNRGFVVFGTTHLPSLLDPALRRPGRFDETISLAQSPNFLNRFEILKNNLLNSLTTLDFLDSSILTENFSELNLLNLITGTKLSLFHQYKYSSIVPQLPFLQQPSLELLKKHKKHKKMISQINPSKALQSFLKSSFKSDLYLQKQFSFFNKKQQSFTSQQIQSSKYFLRNFRLLKYTFLPKGPSHILSLAYSKIGVFLAKSNLLNDPTAYIPLSLDTNILSASNQNQQFFGNAFYSSQEQQKLQLMVFLSGKVSEFFIQKTIKTSVTKQVYENKTFLTDRVNSVDVLEDTFELFNHKFSIFPELYVVNKLAHQKIQNMSPNFEVNSSSVEFSKNQSKKYFQKQNLEIRLSMFKQQAMSKEIENFNSRFNTVGIQKTDFFWTTFGNDQLWRSATPFVFSIIQKRFLFTKNLLLSKMLFFDNKNQRKLPPNPPSSSILMPSKKYENFKRTENDFVQKARFSINEKIQMHQQQRFLKQLYNIPVQEYFRSEMIQNRKTFFSSSFQELAYLDSLTRRSSSSYFYQKKYLGIRHRFSNLNQWWNGFLPEHNTETTYLSDVDWRTMFTSTNTPKVQNQSFEKFKNQSFEFTMDFPDAEQYYNPRNRRWYFNGKFVKNSQKNQSYWLTFDMNLQYEIYYHYLMQSFHQTFEYFDKNREIIDSFAFHLLQKGFLKEVDYLTTFSRFKNI